MSPYEGTPSSKTIAREVSYVVETVVPEGGLGRRLEDMHDFHRQRAITDHYVPRRRDGERDYIRWFFKDLATAEAFAAQFSGTSVMPHSERSNAAWGGRISEIASAVTVPAMRHARLLYVLVPLSLIVVGALVIKQISLREKAQPVAIEDKPPTVAIEAKAPLVVGSLLRSGVKRTSQLNGDTSVLTQSGLRFPTAARLASCLLNRRV